MVENYTSHGVGQIEVSPHLQAPWLEFLQAQGGPGA